MRGRFALGMSHWLGVLAVLVGCHEEESSGGVRTIGPDGGVVSSADETIRITIPPDALLEPVDVEIEESDLPPPALGPAFRVRPNIDLLVEAEVAMRHVLVSDEIVVGAIRRGDFELGIGTWVPLSHATHDFAEEIVTGRDDELSPFYAVLDPRAGVGEDSSTGTTSEGEGESTTTGEDDEGTGFGPLSHELDVQPVWDEHCVTNCHEPGGLNTDVVLTPDRAWEDLLERFPVAANLPYVDPGDPEQSYLLYKLDARQDEAPGGGGVPMPQGAPLLPVQTREMIRAWVEQGAPP